MQLKSIKVGNAAVGGTMEIICDWMKKKSFVFILMQTYLRLTFQIYRLIENLLSINMWMLLDFGMQFYEQTA